MIASDFSDLSFCTRGWGGFGGGEAPHTHLAILEPVNIVFLHCKNI